MCRMWGGYLTATRHPWPCLVFLLPLLAAYEGGVFWLGGKQPETLRNGADTWLHWGLEAFGLSQLYWAPILIALLFVLWSWLRWWDRPGELFGVCAGMAVESVVCAFGLLGLSRVLGPTLDSLGIVMSCPPQGDKALAQVITFVGAGIYEEVVFRLLLFGGAVWVVRQAAVPALLAVLVAAVGSALIFSAAHHAGPYGEPYDAYVFLFRTLAGLYFTLVYQLRGFGIAVGAHACYDVLAGVVVG
jgi:membrane protease YdiL (CAAX protease family)